MNKLPKEKRDRLILVGMGTLFLLILIIFLLIRPQYAAVSDINAQINTSTAICNPWKTPSSWPTRSPPSWGT